MSVLTNTLDQLINDGKKMKSRLYQTILSGQGTTRLLQNFIIHRYPIKNLWTRHVLGVGSRLEDYELRRKFVENAWEEETGGETDSKRHVESFIDVGIALGLERSQCVNGPILEETRTLMDHNLSVCNDTSVDLTIGTAAVLYLMESQPPIVNQQGRSMEYVFRDVYRLPKEGYDFFTHHASADAGAEAVSKLEDVHATACRKVLLNYCTTPELQNKAVEATRRSIELRHRHFDMVYDKFYDASEPVYRHPSAAAAA